ncbi:hypothetical protein [Xanthomonas oryzae]|uniref:hypothetical protein n=1 Tax=Xanthomonas oryzae TaxID=347 RepID=UPI0011816844|nr:hypothetical protein [Xanthomonas oryzae]
MNYHLVSDCALGEIVTVDIDVSYLTGGVGSPISYTISNVQFNDPYAGAYPESLTGTASYMSAGFAAGGGASYGTTTIGDAFSDVSLGGQGGWDASITAAIGTASIDGKPIRRKCGCGK